MQVWSARIDGGGVSGQRTTFDQCVSCSEGIDVRRKRKYR